LSLVATLALAIPASAQSTYQVTTSPPVGFARKEAQTRTQNWLADLIRIDTQNPPGNELRVAEYLEAALSTAPSVETRILEISPERANFVARLHASHPTKKPVLVMAHMDVVGADATHWKTPPFEPTVQDGYLYGRGAIDDKGMLSAALCALFFLAKQRDSLDRDIILLATAGEESGGDGIEWMVEHEFNLIANAEFALNEGGRIRVENGRIPLVNIQTTEKIPYNVTARATGPSGHASIPLPNNSLAVLARAVARLHEWHPPVRMIESTRSYFSGLAQVEADSSMKQGMEILASSQDPAAIEEAADVVSREPRYNAILRTGISVTLLNGGIRTNVIPSEGTANFNVRLLPGEDIQEIVSEMNRVAGESQVVLSINGALRPSPPPSPTTTPLYAALKDAARSMAPGSVVTAFMSTGGTDGAVLRRKGIPTYGILPVPLTVEDELRMHGDNERVPIAGLGWAAEYQYRVLFAVASR